MFSSFALRSWFVVYEIIQGLRLFGRLWAGSGQALGCILSPVRGFSSDLWR
jgi:hypothetical protein